MVSKKRPRVILFPTLDYLTPYQQKKKLLELAGEVKEYNMYENIENVPKISELEKMPYESAKKIIETVRVKHTVKALKEHWGLTGHQIYKKLYPKYGIDLTGRSKPKAIKENIVETIPFVEPVKEKSKSSLQGFQITLEGSFTGEEISDRILRLDQLLNEGNKYSVRLTIIED